MSEDRGPGIRYRVRCWKCGWKGVRTDYPDDCNCYDEWGMYCRADSPGPGCGRGVVYACPNGCRNTAGDFRTIKALGRVVKRPAAVPVLGSEEEEG